MWGLLKLQLLPCDDKFLKSFPPLKINDSPCLKQLAKDSLLCFLQYLNSQWTTKKKRKTIKTIKQHWKFSPLQGYSPYVNFLWRLCTFCFKKILLTVLECTSCPKGSKEGGQQSRQEQGDDSADLTAGLLGPGLNQSSAGDHSKESQVLLIIVSSVVYFISICAIQMQFRKKASLSNFR